MMMHQFCYTISISVEEKKNTSSVLYDIHFHIMENYWFWISSCNFACTRTDIDVNIQGAVLYQE